jgi:hypothetical protein
MYPPFCLPHPILLVSIVATLFTLGLAITAPQDWNVGQKIQLASLFLHSRKTYCCSVLSVAQTSASGMRSLMCFCLLTLLHFKVVPSSGRDDCSVYVKPLSFWENYNMPSPIANTCHLHTAHQFLNVLEEEQFTIREN